MIGIFLSTGSALRRRIVSQFAWSNDECNFAAGSWSAAIEERQPASFAQMRWKTSVPRTLVTRPFGATYVAIPLVATVVGLTKRPDQTVVALQCVVQFLDVWNTTRGPRRLLDRCPPDR